MTQIITNSNGGGAGGGGSGDMLKSVYDPQNINADAFDYDNFTNTPDLSGYQTTSNLVTDLTNPDDTHYPSAKAVSDAITSAGGGDMLKSVYDPNNVAANAFDYNNFTNTPDLSDYVLGPASSTDGDIVLFDGATGKLIKDSGVGLSSKLDASALSNNNYGGAWQSDSTHTPTKGALYDKIHTMDVEIGNKAADTAVVKLTGNQTINGTKTFGTSPVVPSKTSDATNTGTAIATEAQVYNVADDVATINGKIPSAATSSNQLADKNYVDDGINSVTAYYITKNAQGDQWATRAELFAATTFYSGGVVRVPTKNDYTIVLADENHDNATTRYIYNSGWEYQYTVNETALTQAQLDALNSGITSGKVSTYDGYASAISGKQDALTLPATPTQGHLVTWGANNKTLADGGAIPTVPTNVSAFNNDAGYLTSSTGVTSVNSNVGAVTVNEVPSGGNNGDVLTNVSGTPTWQAPSGGITKLFTLSSTSDLTNAQAAYDWYVNGGNPIVKYGSNYYTISFVSTTVIRFCVVRANGAVNAGNIWAYIRNIQFTLSSDTVTGISDLINRIQITSTTPASGTDNSYITLVI